MSQFDTLLNELGQVAQQRAQHVAVRQVAPPPHRPRAPVPGRREAMLASRPSASLAKALSDVAEMTAENALAGFRLGMVVLCRGLSGPFRIIDIDASAGRAKLRQVRDASNDPTGANFVEQEAWASLAAMSPAPGFDDVGGVGFADSLAVTERLRASEQQMEAIRARARALVAVKRKELSRAIHAGEISAMDAAQSEALLNHFSIRMGI